MSAPAASPSHQVNHIFPKLLQGANPPSHKLVKPIVGLIIVLTKAASKTKVSTPCGLSKTFAPRAKRLTRYAPASPSRVLPRAIPKEVIGDPAVTKFTANAAIKIAGQ